MKTTTTTLMLLICALLVTGCKKKEKFYDTQVELTRFDILRYSPDGKARDCDLEFSYPDCPGEQVEVIRGGAEFAECIKKYKMGDKIPAKVLYHWDKGGFYDWDIHEMGGCKRPPDPDDEASFDSVKECEPIVSNGVEEGFMCNYIPQKALLAKCPWFARH